MIVSCGEALIDFFRVKNTSSFDALIGGSPLNVAVALSKVGVNAALMTNISNDEFGDMHVQHLQSVGVSTQFITRFDHLSGLMFVQYNEDRSANYNLYGHNTVELNFNRTDMKFSDDIESLNFGSFSLVCGITSQSFEELINAQH